MDNLPPLQIGIRSQLKKRRCDDSSMHDDFFHLLDQRRGPSNSAPQIKKTRETINLPTTLEEVELDLSATDESAPASPTRDVPAPESTTATTSPPYHHQRRMSKLKARVALPALPPKPNVFAKVKTYSAPSPALPKQTADSCMSSSNHSPSKSAVRVPIKPSMVNIPLLQSADAKR